MSTDTDLRFFLAHDKSTPDDTIDAWVEECTEVLSDYYEDREVTVVSGRDDYQRRAKEAGGWKGWSRSVGTGTLFTGDPLFHGIIRPAVSSDPERQRAGRATFDMVATFLELGKTAWVWYPDDTTFRAIERVEKLDGDSWIEYGVLHVCVDE